PVGPYEELDRLVPRMIRSAMSGEPIPVTAPRAIRDYLPVRELAGLYVSTAELLIGNKARILRPSGWVSPTFDWVQKVMLELFPRCGLNKVPLKVDQGNPDDTAYQNDDFMETLLDW